MGDSHDHNTIANNQITGSNISFGSGAKQTIYNQHQHVQEPHSLGGKTQIFLSHSSNDNAFSAKLAQSLRVLGYDIWYDIERLNAGDAWWEKIKDEVTARAFFLVVLSPDAITSSWVNNELAIAWAQRNPAHGKHIIPILYRECECPIELKTLQHVSFMPPVPYQEALNQLIRGINASILRD